MEPIIERIFKTLLGKHKEFEFTVSMGVVKTELADNDYETLFHCADQALYAAKRAGRGRFCFYHRDMPDTIGDKTQSSLSKIESNDPNRPH